MTRPIPDPAPREASLPTLPRPQDVLDTTDWGALHAAVPPSPADLPAMLARFLDPDPAMRGVGLKGLHDITYQNSVYGAIVPAVRYVAAILADPCLDAPVPPQDRYPGEPPSRSLRVVLLEWLGGHAYEADDVTVAATRRHGVPDPSPAVRALLALRPELYAAVRPFLDHPDTDVRHTAVVTAVPLVEHPDLAGHRDRLALRGRRLLADPASERYHRNRIFDALQNWGHDTTDLLTPDDIAAFERYAHYAKQRSTPGGYTEDPPF